MERIAAAFTVLIPVYNTEKYVEECINSIYAQTLQDFELIVIDDASTDSSKLILEKLQKKYSFTLICNDTNKGHSNCLNHGIQVSKTHLVARMDSDDIASPHRFEKQYKFLMQHPSIGFCGTTADYLVDNHAILEQIKIPQKHADIKCELLFNNVVINGSLMFRKDLIIDNNHYYSQEMEPAEDYAVWAKLIDLAEFENIQENLLRIRRHEEQISVRKKDIRKDKIQKIHIIQLNDLEIYPTKEELDLHYSISHEHLSITFQLLKNLDNWLSKLYIANTKTKIYPESEFRSLLHKIWIKFNAGQTKFGLKYFLHLKKSMFSFYKDLSVIQKIKLIVKCLLKL